MVGNRAYIFGGETATGKLASTEMHAITVEASGKPESEYSIIPAVPDSEGGRVLGARKQHAACAFNVCVAVFGGLDEKNKLVDQESTIWLFNTAKSAWETLEASTSHLAPCQRSAAHLFNHKNNLILYGGRDASGSELRDAWKFNYVGKTWHQLPDAPVSTPSATYADGALYLISAPNNVGSDVHFLRLESSDTEQQTWHTLSFPTNPLTPGPQPRTGAGLVHISPGYGRNFLLYFFGARAGPASAIDTQAGAESNEREYWSDLWTYQVPATVPEARITTKVTDAAAGTKDMIRSAFGFDTGKHSWAEVGILPPADLQASEGKVHPGPRGYLGCDVMRDGKSVVLWGGINAKGEKEGDGWIIKLQ